MIEGSTMAACVSTSPRSLIKRNSGTISDWNGMIIVIRISVKHSSRKRNRPFSKM